MTTTASTERQRRELAEVFVALLEADPLVCDRNGLAGLVAQGLRVRNWLDAFDTKVARRTAALAREGKAEAPANLLAGGGRRGKRDAEAAAERGAICEQLPVVADSVGERRVVGCPCRRNRRARSQPRRRRQRTARRMSTSIGQRGGVAATEEFGRECDAARQAALRRRRHQPPRESAPPAQRADVTVEDALEDVDAVDIAEDEVVEDGRRFPSRGPKIRRIRLRRNR